MLLNFAFPMSNHVKYHFRCLLTIYISCSVRCLFKYFVHFMELHISLNCNSSLYILIQIFFSDRWITNIVTPHLPCPFIFLGVSFKEQIKKFFWNLIYWLFTFVVNTFESSTILANQKVEKIFFNVFFWEKKIFYILCSIFLFYIHFLHFLLKYIFLKTDSISNPPINSLRCTKKALLFHFTYKEMKIKILNDNQKSIL